MSNINEVRQILMNELGLTRDLIRGMAEDIVREVVNQRVSRMLADGHIEKMVNAEMQRFVRDNRYDSNSVRTLIAEAAGAAFKERVRKILDDSK